MRTKKIGYALGGGAARGLSHIGVLKVLHEHDIRPDFIAGTSIGSIIGALYAGGYDPEDIEQLVLGLDWKKLVYFFDMTLPVTGLIQGKRVVALLKSILGDITFSDLRCDFRCVATDIVSGEEVVLSDGSLVEAVRASISIPGIFTPVEHSGRYLVDGGLVNTVPVSVCREMGADYVIGVNVIPEPLKAIGNPHKAPLIKVHEPIDIKKGKAKKPLESSRMTKYALQAHIMEIESATKKFLDAHRLQTILKPPKAGKESTIASKKVKSPKLIDVLSQSVMISEYRLALENMKDADLAISPDVQEIGFWQFNNAARAIEIGERAARIALSKNKLAAIPRQLDIELAKK